MNKQEAARANKAKVAAATKMAGEHVPRKGKRAHWGGPEKGTPKKGRTDKFCKWCKAVDRPFTTYDTRVCRRVSNDSSTMVKPTEYFDSARKPCKKTGSGDSSQMAYLTENLTKHENKLNKSKKHSKKRARDSSDSDLNSDHKKYTVVPEIGTQQINVLN